MTRFQRILLHQPKNHFERLMIQQLHGGGGEIIQEVSGIPPLMLPDSVGKPLKYYEISGATVQDGEPTPENPVEVRGVGDFDVEKGQYKIPILTSGKNLWDSTSKTTNESGVERFGCEYTAGTYYIENKTSYYFYWRDDGVSGSKSFPPNSAQTVTATNKLIIWGGYSTEQIFVHNRPPITTNIYTDKPLYSGDKISYPDNQRTNKTGVIILDGVTNSVRFNSDDKLPFIVLRTEIVAPIGSRPVPNTHFKAYGKLTSNACYVIAQRNIVMATDLIPQITSTETANAWLKSQYDAGTPVTVYYPLETVTTEPITLPEIPTLQGNNVLSVETDVQPEIMTVKYYKKP